MLHRPPESVYLRRPRALWIVLARFRVPEMLTVRTRLNSIRPYGTGRNGTRLFMVVRSVPREKRVWGSSRILGLASQITVPTTTFGAWQDTTTAGWCAISVHLFLKNCFSPAAWNLFDVGNQHQLTRQIIFHSVRFSALWRGVKTRPYPPVPRRHASSRAYGW